MKLLDVEVQQVNDYGQSHDYEKGMVEIMPFIM